MKIIVCVKQVPDTSGVVAVKADGTMDRAAMATISHPDRRHGLLLYTRFHSRSDGQYILACGKQFCVKAAVLPIFFSAIHIKHDTVCAVDHR